MRRFHTSVALLIVGILGVAAPPASAQTIEMRLVVEDDSFTAPPGEFCDFALRVRIVGQYKTVDYFNADGDLVRSRDTNWGHPVVRIIVTAHGTTLTSNPVVFMLETTYAEDGSVLMTESSGSGDTFIVPGEGPVWLDTGRVVKDGDGDVIFMAGPVEPRRGENAEFCAAFG